jgi:hypothetical protein
VKRAGCLSSLRRQGGEFTFEVQHFGEGLCGCPEVKAFAWRAVVGGDERAKALVRQGGEIGLAWQEASHAADGVLDAALLPGRVAITEEGCDRQAMQGGMPGKLGAVVEGNGPAQLDRQGAKQSDEMACEPRAALLIGRTASSRREVRSCTVRTAWPYLENSMRSASQWPGVLRSAASGGRSANETRPSMRFAELPPFLPRKPRLLLPRGR